MVCSEAALLFFKSYLIMHGINMFPSLKMPVSHRPRRELSINSSVETRRVSLKSQERQGHFSPSFCASTSHVVEPP
jgi:hypothetical protein